MFYKSMDISQHTMERLLQAGGGALVSPLLDRKSWSLRIHWHRWCDVVQVAGGCGFVKSREYRLKHLKDFKEGIHFLLCLSY